LKAKIGVIIGQVVECFHFLAHHVAELRQLITWTAFQDASVMTVSCGLLEGYSRLYVVLILGIGVQDVASLRSVRIRAAAMSKYTIYVRGAVMICLACETRLHACDFFTTTVKTSLEVSDIYHSSYGDIQGSISI